MFGRRLITKKEVTKMNRRKFLLSSTVAAAASASLPALASTTERFSTKQRPVDTMNRIEGWTQGKVKPVKVRNLMIGEGRPKIFAPTTDKTIRLSSGSNPQVSFSDRFYREVRSASAMLCNARQLRRPQLCASHGAMRERRRCRIPTQQPGGGL